MSDRESKPPFARQFAKWRARLGLGHIPELELFPSDMERNNALLDLTLHGGSPTSLGRLFIIAFVVLFVSFMCFLLVVNLRSAKWFEFVEGMILTAGLLYVFVPLVRRTNAHAYLRHRLNGCSVPICVPCGYQLKGLAESTTKCPECGKPIDAITRRAIAESSSKQSPLREQRKDFDSAELRK